MVFLTAEERKIAEKINELKRQAGSHSPSIFAMAERIKDLNIKIDACFLANSYATDLFTEYLNEELVKTSKLRDVLEFYPSQNRQIAEKLAKHLKISPGKIFIGNGASEIIQAIIHNFAGKKLIVNIPTFSSYYEFAKEGTEVVFHHLKKADGFRLDIDVLIRRVKEEKPETLVIINPNNPDGGYVPNTEIKRVLRELKGVGTIVVDESFVHFAFQDAEYALHSCVDFADEFDNLVVIKSMSKDFGIAGIRVGYAVMEESRVDGLLKNGFLWNVSGLAEYFLGLHVREDFLKRYDEIRVRSIKETQEFFAKLSEIKSIKVYPSMANFVLVELLDGSLSEDFVSKLLINHGIYVRVGNDKIGLEGEFVRIASRKRHENDVIVRAIRDVLC